MTRLIVLATVAADSKRFKKEAHRELKYAFRTELNHYISAGNVPANRKQTEEILYHHQRIDSLVLLVILPLDVEYPG